jgi:hypothetical protein
MVKIRFEMGAIERIREGGEFVEDLANQEKDRRWKWNKPSRIAHIF